MGKLQLSLSDDEYRRMLRERYGVKSAKDLMPAQGKDLVLYFKTLGFMPVRRNKVCARCTPRPKKDAIPVNVVYPVSPGQLAKIKQLQNDIKWRAKDGFSRWLLRYFNIKTIQTSVEASAVIWALLKLWRSQRKCSCVLVNKRNARGGNK
jgi:hypothetical protein